MVSNGFVVNPDLELLPDYKIGPFRTSDVIINRNLPDSDFCDNYFNDRFNGLGFCYTVSGRQALYKALEYYKLEIDDYVTIFTTSGNSYISGCVTKEIEKFCKWSRQIETKTKLIFVNHEFGYPFENLNGLKKYKLPIIEDCAHSFFSRDTESLTGTIGDFVIYSFPKIFPIQMGGLLVFKRSIAPNILDCTNSTEGQYIRKVISHSLCSKEEIIQKRQKNYNFLKEKLSSMMFYEYFSSSGNTVPGVFMFRTDRHKMDLSTLKKYLWSHGVQCSVFYGEEAFFIPVHQALEEDDMEYFVEIIKSFDLKFKL